MQPIPMKHRKQIAIDSYFNRSCLSGQRATWKDKIVIHHPWTYAGKQISEMWNYLPLLASEHDYNSPYPSAHNSKLISEKLKLIAISRGDLQEIKKLYPKKDWDQEIKAINFNIKKL